MRGPAHVHAAPRFKPVHWRLDILTALYRTWSYIHVHRALVAFDALAMPMPTAPPRFTTAVAPSDHAAAVNYWLTQTSIDAEEARFTREMPIPVHDERGHVSLRAYVSGLVERMESAGRRGLFDDLDDMDDGSSSAAARDALKTDLVAEARACLTFALAYDVRWRRLVMAPPGHLFRECAPDIALVRPFVAECVRLTRAFLDRELTLAEVAQEAADAWPL